MGRHPLAQPGENPQEVANPAPSDRPSPKHLDLWFSSALSILPFLIQLTLRAPALHQGEKLGGPPLLSTLRKEFTKASRKARKVQTCPLLAAAKWFRLGYFKAITKAKAS